MRALVAKQPAKLFIDGEYVDAVSGKTYENICPINGKGMGMVAEADAADVDIAVKAAKQAFDDWASTPARVWSSTLPCVPRIDALVHVSTFTAF